MSTILIADDRDVDRRYLSTLLGYYGHRVIEASDGARALDVVLAEHPDLIISDVLMPVLDGYELVRRLRAQPAHARTPILFYTAMYHETAALALARECGVDEVLTKPSEPDAIVAKIHSLLGRSQDAPAPATHGGEPDRLQAVTSELAEKIRELEASEQRLAAVVSLGQRLTGQTDPAVLIQDVCAAARDLTLAEHAVAGIVDDQRTGFAHFSATGGAARSPGAHVPKFAGPTLKPVLDDRMAVRLSGPELKAAAPDGVGAQGDLRSALAVPIASATRVYGWIAVMNKLGAEAFSDRDEQVAVMVGLQAGTAYEKGRLVDDLRRHAALLHASEERTHYALSAGRMGIWELDLRTGQVLWSPAMAEVFGLTPDRAPTTGDAFDALIHPDDRHLLADALERAIREGAEYDVEFRGLLPNGDTRWMAGRARVDRDADGSPLRLLGVGMDISQRKSLEAQFRQSQKLEAVGRLAGGVAHDFNNLLTAILGYATLLGDTFEPGDQRRSDLEEVRKAGERASALTRQLLAFSRKQVVQPVPVDLNAVVGDLRPMLARLIGEDITLVTVLDADRPVVRADPGQLEQVLMNLVVNARDAMPSGGRLAIETANVDLDANYAISQRPVQPGPYVRLAVSDTGVGMDDETKQRLFEPFFTTKPIGKGTGLGLATVYGIVRQSGGYVWAYSELGHGTTFKIYFPRFDAPDAAPPRDARVDRASRGHETILVVEDEPAVRALTRVILERAGYRVFDAADPAEAHSIFDEHGAEIDMLVTDVVMPGASGPRLFDRLVRQRPDLRVLYMSGYTDDAILSHGQLDPTIKFLQKPFTADGLARSVREVLDR